MKPRFLNPGVLSKNTGLSKYAYSRPVLLGFGASDELRTPSRSYPTSTGHRRSGPLPKPPPPNNALLGLPRRWSDQTYPNQWPLGVADQRFKKNSGLELRRFGMIKRQASPDIRTVHAALKSYRDSIGKPTQKHHYINEVRLIYYAITGRNQAVSDIKSVTRLKRKLYAQILCINCQLISEGVDYQLRKQVCRQVFQNQKTKSIT